VNHAAGAFKHSLESSLEKNIEDRAASAAFRKAAYCAQVSLIAWLFGLAGRAPVSFALRPIFSPRSIGATLNQIGSDGVESEVADLEVLPAGGLSTGALVVSGKDRTGCLQSLITGVTADGGKCLITTIGSDELELVCTTELHSSTHYMYVSTTLLMQQPSHYSSHLQSGWTRKAGRLAR